MTPFKSKAPGPSESPTSSVSGGPRNSMSAGPITKIKEKTERSIGMSRASVDYTGPSYEQDTFSRRTSTQGRSSLTPGSQPGSRPPSRHGSNVSLNDSEDGRRGSSARRTSSFRTGARQSSLRPTPVGFGSGVPRKTSTPTANGRNRTDSNSSTDRTPMSNRMRSKSYITPRPSKMIKSTSESNIPVFIGCHSNNTSSTSTPIRVNSRPNSRNTSTSSMAPPAGAGMLKSRTPSSSSIPVPSNTLRTRTPSGSGSRIPRTGSGVGSGLRQTQKTTSYSADGSRFSASTDLRSAVESHRSWQS
jgi:hypothetical protein